jgi:hypothetical protein
MRIPAAETTESIPVMASAEVIFAEGPFYKLRDRFFTDLGVAKKCVYIWINYQTKIT